VVTSSSELGSNVLALIRLPRESMVMWATFDAFTFNDLNGIMGVAILPCLSDWAGVQRNRNLAAFFGQSNFGGRLYEVCSWRRYFSWKLKRDGLQLTVSIPINCAARVRMPMWGMRNVRSPKAAKTSGKAGRFSMRQREY
jgi:hypothetical protein